MDEPQYYLAAGVRRAVAARELGWESISVKIKKSGAPDVFTDVPLSSLHSPKQSVSVADLRYLSVFHGLSRPGERAKMIRVGVELLGSPGQTRSFPLSSVKLEP